MTEKVSVESGVDPMDESLKVLQPEEQFVEIDGERIYVHVFTFGELAKAVKHIAKLATVLMQVNEDTSMEMAILQGLAEHADDVLSLISLATGTPVEFFQLIPMDKGLDLAVMTYKVNESFFAQKIAPKLQELFPVAPVEESPKETPTKAKKIGSTSSKS